MPPTLFADRYVYDDATDRLGGGNFGVVYVAQDTWQKFPVALKLLKKGTLPDEAYREAQLLTQLGGNFVLQVHNTGVADDIPFLATRIAPERSTEDRLQAAPFGVPPDVAIAWTRNALLGLAITHEAGWVHRDIKPANVFLQRPDWSLIGDFGVAGRMDANGRVSAHGDIRIRAPEMVTAGSGDIRSDIFSTGVTLYRLLSGRWPFEGTVAEVAAAIAAGRYTRLSDVSPHVSRGLEARVAKAMSLDPADRFANAREMHAAFSRRKLVPRAWQEVPPHPGHTRCWTERDRLVGGKARFQTCVIPRAGGRFDIVSQRAIGAQKRVTSACFDDVAQADTPKRLRAAFRAMG